MKSSILKNISLACLAAVLFAGVSPAQNKFVAGAGASMLFPIGTLHDRYNPAAGGSFYFGKQVSENWTWVGKAEYYKFTELNKDKLSIKRIVDYTRNGTEYSKDFVIPLDKIDMELEVAGASVNAKANLYDADIFRSNLDMGFGMYRWKNYIAPYKDTMYVTVPGMENRLVAEVLNVPGNTQVDWSGGLNLGLEAEVRLFEPVWFSAGASYKVVIGELWPLLSLDLENVSAFQMFEIKAGIKAEF
ncbi:MAG: hypothetical protein ACM3SM_04110 [Bacteroidota bacterium]